MAEAKLRAGRGGLDLHATDAEIMARGFCACMHPSLMTPHEAELCRVAPSSSCVAGRAWVPACIKRPGAGPRAVELEIWDCKTGTARARRALRETPIGAALILLKPRPDRDGPTTSANYLPLAFAIGLG